MNIESICPVIMPGWLGFAVMLWAVTGHRLHREAKRVVVRVRRR